MDNAQLTQRVIDIDKRLAVIDERLQNVAPRPWVELFVKEVVQPIKDSIASIEHSMTELSKDGQELYTAFKESIKKEEDRKKKLDEERTITGFFKKWTPIVAGLLTLITFYRVLGTIAESWLKAHGF